MRIILSATDATQCTFCPLSYLLQQTLHETPFWFFFLVALFIFLSFHFNSLMFCMIIFLKSRSHYHVLRTETFVVNDEMLFLFPTHSLPFSHRLKVKEKKEENTNNCRIVFALKFESISRAVSGSLKMQYASSYYSSSFSLYELFCLHSRNIMFFQQPMNNQNEKYIISFYIRSFAM